MCRSEARVDAALNCIPTIREFAKATAEAAL
jgi:hypothetical protein